MKKKGKREKKSTVRRLGEPACTNDATRAMCNVAAATPAEVATVAPDTTIAPGGHLILWFTGDANGFPEVDAKLSSDGESIYGEDSSGTSVFSMSFDAQEEDVSFGRYPDGSDTWQQMSPTPGANNTDLLTVELSTPLVPGSVSLEQNYPNPFNPNTQFHYSLTNTENI